MHTSKALQLWHAMVYEGMQHEGPGVACSLLLSARVFWKTLRINGFLRPYLRICGWVPSEL